MRRIDLHPDRIDITIDPARFCAWIREPDGEVDVALRSDRPTVTLSVPARLKQRGNELRFVIDGAVEEAPADASLPRLLACAYLIRKRLIDDRASIDDICREQDLTASYVTRIVRLSLLAPDIIADLFAGRFPDVTATKLMTDTRFPLEWTAQRETLRAL